MGRMAEALKRAEQERKDAMGRRAQSSPGAGHSSGSAHASGGTASTGPSSSTALLDAPAIKPPLHDAPAQQPSAPAQEHVAPPPPVPGMAESLVAYYEKSSLVTEQYRSLRTRLLSQNPQGEHQVIAITSAIPREGKSVTTLNLGCIMAEIRHQKVLMVDGDFRRSTLHKLLNLPSKPGLTDVLAGEAAYEDVIQPTPLPNLFFIPAGGAKDRSAAELLSNPLARQLVRRMNSEFHYTFVDTPPATTVTDVGIIGQMCNGVVLLVRLNFTPEPLAQRAVRLLRVNKVPILGCLVIGHADRSVGYGYGQTYGYGYYRHDGGSRGSDKR